MDLNSLKNMNLSNPNTRAVLIAGAVVVVGSAFLIYQFSKSKDTESLTIITTGATEDDLRSNNAVEETKTQEENIQASNVKFSIRTFARLRPLTNEELANKVSRLDWAEKKMNSRATTIAFDVKSTVRKGIPSTFPGFDKIFNEYTKPIDFFDTAIKPSLLTTVMTGKSVCLLNCGFEGSGYDTILMGDNINNNNNDNNNDGFNGIYSLSADCLLNSINSINADNNNNNLSLYIKYYEFAYDNSNKEIVIDMLSDNLNQCTVRYNMQTKECVIQGPKIRNEESGTVESAKLVKKEVKSGKEVLELINDGNKRYEAMIEAEIEEEKAGNKKKKVRNDPKLGHSLVVLEIDGNGDGNGNGNGGKIGIVNIAPSNEYLIDKKKAKWGYKIDRTTVGQKEINQSLISLGEIIDNIRKKDDINSVKFDKHKFGLVLKEFLDKDGNQGIVVANVSPLRDGVKQSLNVLDFARGLKGE